MHKHSWQEDERSLLSIVGLGFFSLAWEIWMWMSYVYAWYIMMAPEKQVCKWALPIRRYRFFFFFLKIRRYRFWNVLNWLANAKNFSSLRYVYLVKDEKKSLGITYKQDEMIACIFALTSNAFLEDWKWLSPPLRFEKINNLVFSLTMVREYFKFWKVFLDQTLPMISENLFS